MHEAFEKLAVDVDRRWHEKEFDPDAFPEVASSALREARLHERLDPLDPARAAVRALSMPKQLDLSLSFGEPPLTVFQSDLFDIDVYYWLDSTTAIHEHGFCGAFGVMAGESLHSRYEFRERKQINRQLYLGELEVQTCQHLEKGDVCEIPAGPGLIHSLFHLERPSVSVVVRADAKWATPQRQFFWPGIALGSALQPHQMRRRQCLDMLAKVDHASFMKELLSALEKAPPEEFVHLLLGLRSSLGKTTDLVETLGEVGARHRELVEESIEAIKNQKRTIKLTEIRAETADPEERYLLALFLNLQDGETLLRLTRERWPGKKPEDVFATVLGRLFERFPVPPFGLPEDPQLTSICAQLLMGKSPADTAGESEANVKAVAKNSVFRRFVRQ